MNTTHPRFRSAGADDAGRVAALHADSWRRHYRGAYSDSYLDGDIDTERRAVWSARMAAPAGAETVLAEHDGRLVGFIHVIFDEDPRWGSLVDNLHVAHDQQRTGVGRRLLARAARAVQDRATGPAMYLWVLEQNLAAQRFYRASGATAVETAIVGPPGGDPSRLAGSPRKLRMAWPDVAPLTRPVVRVVHLTGPVFRALAEGDLAAANAISPVPLTGYLAGPETRGVWRRRSAQADQDPASAAWVTGIIWDADREVAVGAAGFHGPPDDSGMVEIGYRVDPAYRRSGYARAAMEALLGRAGKEPGVRTVRVSIRPDNLASYRLAMQYGFRQVGEQWDDEDGLEIIYEVAAGQ